VPHKTAASRVRSGLLASWHLKTREQGARRVERATEVCCWSTATATAARLLPLRLLLLLIRLGEWGRRGTERRKRELRRERGEKKEGPET
jgi:hypothetical protein